MANERKKKIYRIFNRLPAETTQMAMEPYGEKLKRYIISLAIKEHINLITEK